ncbi:MAG: dihydrolipoamide acetyltransferase family protein, partial [Spirochaetota bacterium]
EKAKKEKEAKKTEVPKEEKTEVEEISQIRRTIATKMVESKFTAPHAVSFEEVEISKLVQLREEKKKALAEKDIKLSYTAFIIKAVTIALKNHKKLNSRLDLEKNRIIYNYYYNIGIATDTPAGLMVPVIKDTDKKSIIEISQEINDLVKRAKERKLNIDELRGSTFSITNYGSIAGIYGVPIINYPDVAILGIGRILDKPVVKDGAVVPGKVLPLSISIDHRIVDGADAARFIKEIMELLADPMIMLMM